ncbi:MAG TPA: glycoside hydrolase family 15 protein [Candidatus Dojkabacteria bacterium]|nr:glycoside hydrolase family 15 protein [Candidatus Dojkabacteria bacterium]
MSTALVIGNGNLLININNSLNIVDVYWPHVGQENHLSRHPNEIFLRINGEFTNFTDGSWQITPGYLGDSLTCFSTVYSSKFQMKITFADCILQNKDILIRNFSVENLSEKLQEVFIYFKSNFYILGDDVGDTALWYTPAQALVHYKKNRYLATGSSAQIYQFSTAGPEDNNKQGCVPNWESGELWNNPVVTGSAQSCISYRFQLNPNERKDLDYFIICGRSFEGIKDGASYIRNHDSRELMKSTSHYWENWVLSKVNNYFSGKFPKVFEEQKLNEKMLNLYKRSLLVIRTQFDNNGAIIAANDSTFLKMGGKDTYSYFWPRDGAMVVTALIEVGYGDLAKSFFRYCKRALTKEGYLMHKYYTNLDDGIGSTWHPWVDKGGNLQLPIQIDETALVLWALWKHYERFGDQEFLNEMWDNFILPAGDFLIHYRYKEAQQIQDLKSFVGGFQGNSDDLQLDLAYNSSGLPRPSYNLWEIKRGIHSFSVASVYAGLKAAASLSMNYGRVDKAKEYEVTAKEVKASFEKYLFDNRSGRFITMIYCDHETKACVIDKSLDSSLYSLWAFDMFSLNDLRIDLTMKAIEETLWLKTDIGGIARKEDDWYLRGSQQHLPGNPWFISTLWVAQYWIRKRNLETAKKYLRWVLDHTDSTGLIAEQADPYTGFSLSVKPLTWAHAELVRTVNMLKDY